MYDEKIEGLIKAALADGVLTEKEKQVLFKRAQEQGIDLDEFEMVLDARLVELEKEEKEKAAKSAPKSDKYGSVRKCPACGAIVGAFMGICPECGFEFSAVDANLSSKKLSELLLNESSTTKKQEIIETFPLPNTKADLLEFLTALKPRILDAASEFSGAYYKKYAECIEKAKVAYFGDKQLQTFIDDFEKLEKDLKKKKIIALLKKHWIFVAAGVVAIVVIISTAISSMVVAQAEKQYQKQSELFATYINEGKPEDAKAIMKSMDFSYHAREEYDKALQLIELYVAHKDVTNAIDVYEKIAPKHTNHSLMQFPQHCNGTNCDYEPKATKLLYNALIEAERMEEAWNYHLLETDNKSIQGRNAEYYYSYMNDVIKYYCKKGNKSAARKFVNIYSLWFEENIDNSSYYSSEKEYRPYRYNTAKAKLLRIIDNY